MVGTRAAIHLRRRRRVMRVRVRRVVRDRVVGMDRVRVKAKDRAGVLETVVLTGLRLIERDSSLVIEILM